MRKRASASGRTRRAQGRGVDPALRSMEAIGKTLDAEAGRIAREGPGRARADEKAALAGRRGARGRRRGARTAATFSAVEASGLADVLTPAVFLPFATLRPPYDWGWTWTKWINYAPGQLEAYARPDQGKFGIECDSYASSNQLNRSRARAGIGVRFQPPAVGFLGIRPVVSVDEDWSLRWKHRVAHTFGWSGLLVKEFDEASAEIGTPIDRRGEEFDEHGGGSIIPPAEMTVTIPGDGDFWAASLFVRPTRWYAIWVWCGGGIRAAGWQTILGVNVGSDAKAELDVVVPEIKVFFAPLDAVLPKLQG